MEYITFGLSRYCDKRKLAGITTGISLLTALDSETKQGLRTALIVTEERRMPATLSKRLDHPVNDERNY